MSRNTFSQKPLWKSRCYKCKISSSSQYWNWERSHRGRHWDFAFCVYTVLLYEYTNTSSIEA